MVYGSPVVSICPGLDEHVDQTEPYEKDNTMDISQLIPNISDETLRNAIQKEYEKVAVDPDKGYDL